MRFKNQRYGDPEHLRYYASGWKLDALAKHLKRDEKTIKRWLSGEQKMPWWVPELLRLERYEKYHQLRYMGVNAPLAKLGIVNGKVLDFPDINKIQFDKKKKQEKTLIEISNEEVIKKFKSK